MAEQSNPTTSRRRHHRRHRRNSRKRKLRNGVLIATIAVGMLTVLGLKLIGRGKVHQAEIVQRSYPVRVISVVDGDTFLGLDDGGDTLTYNVYSIEAPEIEQPQGYEARKYLYNMILQRRVEVTPKGGRTPQGVRVIATTRDNDDVADLMLRSGFAWYRNDTVNELRYIRSERFAQEEGVGIWASPGGPHSGEQAGRTGSEETDDADDLQSRWIDRLRQRSALAGRLLGLVLVFAALAAVCAPQLELLFSGAGQTVRALSGILLKVLAVGAVLLPIWLAARRG